MHHLPLSYADGVPCPSCQPNEVEAELEPSSVALLMREMLVTCHDIDRISVGQSLVIMRRLLSIAETSRTAYDEICTLAAHGFDDWDHSLSAVGNETGVSKQAVHDRRAKMLAKLRNKHPQLADLIKFKGGRTQ